MKAKQQPNRIQKIRTKSFSWVHLAVVAVFVAIVSGVGTYFLASSKAATPCTGGNFTQGTGYYVGPWEGNCVKDIQSIVNAYTGGLTADGYYGSVTASHVKTFQRYHNDSVDGVVGPQTWKSLCSFARTWPYASPAYKAGQNAGCFGWLSTV